MQVTVQYHKNLLQVFSFAFLKFCLFIIFISKREKKKNTKLGEWGGEED